MKRVFWLGAITGAITGLLGAVLVSEFDWSLLSVAIFGGVIGLVIGWLFKLKK